MTDGRLANKVALITGSDSGIGQATAIEFARKAPTSRRRAENEVGRMFDAAVAEFGVLDILMNNAGVDASGTPVAELSTEVWDRAIRTNVYGYFFCARRFIQLRLASGGGCKTP
jgi:glucose 1-dehydrogenase